jgi:hypothetical protein
MTIFKYELADDEVAYQSDGTEYDMKSKIYNLDLSESNSLTNEVISLVYGQDVIVSIANNSIGVQPETGMLISSSYIYENSLNL